MPTRRAGTAPRLFAEHVHHQIREPVNDPGLLPEVGVGVDHTEGAHHTRDPVQRAEGLAELGEGLKAAEARRLHRLLHGALARDLAGDCTVAVRPVRSLAGDMCEAVHDPHRDVGSERAAGLGRAIPSSLSLASALMMVLLERGDRVDSRLRRRRGRTRFSRRQGSHAGRSSPPHPSSIRVRAPARRRIRASPSPGHFSRYERRDPGTEDTHRDAPGTIGRNEEHAPLRCMGDSPGSAAANRRGQRPWNTGVRFSTNARAASLWSSVKPVRVWPHASRSSTRREALSAALRLRFMYPKGDDRSRRDAFRDLLHLRVEVLVRQAPGSRSRGRAPPPLPPCRRGSRAHAPSRFLRAG